MEAEGVEAEIWETTVWLRRGGEGGRAAPGSEVAAAGKGEAVKDEDAAEPGKAEAVGGEVKEEDATEEGSVILRPGGRGRPEVCR